MPKGTCDHALDPNGYNEVTLTKGNGTVTVDVRWLWDGVSIWPACAGEVIQIHYVNAGTDTWRAQLPNKTRGEAFVDIPPGTDETVTGNLLRQAGLDTLAAIVGLELTRVP